MLNVLAFFLVFTLMPLTAWSANLEGRIFNDKGPMKAARVEVYKSFEDFRSGTALLSSQGSDERGLFRLDLPEGTYYFVARGKEDGKEYFAYHGNNPQTIGKDGLWMILMANDIRPLVSTKGLSSIKGVVTYKGKPVSDAYISLYAPESIKLKGLGFKTESVNPDGTFNLAVPPGNYVVIAKKMEGGRNIRPLKKGDLYCYCPHNPVEVKADNVVEIEVPCYPKGDREAFVDFDPRKPKSYLTVGQSAEQAKFGIKGKVTNLAGKPMAGLYVLAYKSEAPILLLYHLSHGSEFSGETDQEGNYFIPLNTDGKYNVIARNTLGRAPYEKEIYGIYEGNPQQSVLFKKDSVVTDIDIVVGKAMDESIKSVLKDSSPINSVVYKDDYTIESDTVWQGNISIGGKVLVKRGVTLTIEPGTVIKFDKVDKDKNSIGDGEIIVEGRIIAKGSAESRIIFTSVLENGEARDWAHVMLLATGSDNLFEYCEFRYAFSGIQLIYSGAAIRNCVFTRNQEGIRFNKANLVLEHNNFFENEVGVRFASLEGKVVIRDNVINNNSVGILFMQPQRKTVDFETDTPPTGFELPLITNNNIFGNLDYNFKMGERKSIDLDMRNNWWGSAKKEEIEASVFDKNADSSLAAIIYSPCLEQPAKGAGVTGK